MLPWTARSSDCFSPARKAIEGRRFGWNACMENGRSSQPYTACIAVQIVTGRQRAGSVNWSSTKAAAAHRSHEKSTSRRKANPGRRGAIAMDRIHYVTAFRYLNRANETAPRINMATEMIPHTMIPSAPVQKVTTRQGHRELLVAAAHGDGS
jgi:hypothetical protein